MEIPDLINKALIGIDRVSKPDVETIIECDSLTREFLNE